MILSFWTTAMVPVSYFPWQIARQISRHQVVFSRETTSSVQTWTRVKSDSVVVHNSADPGPQLPSDPSGPWKMWLLGAIMLTVLSFFSSKWGPLLKIKNEAVEKAERVTKTIEKVAEEVDKVAEEIEADLPEGGKLREAVVAVDEVAKATAKDAELVEDVINKVEEMEEDVDSFMEATKNPKPTSTSAQGD